MKKIKNLVIVDGYNYIFNSAGDIVLSRQDLAGLRDKLVSDLVTYKHIKDCDIIVVFDARGSRNHLRGLEEINMVRIIYSRSRETADSVIEELVVNESYKRKVFVVTSDYSQQKVVFRKNTYRKSVREFGLEMDQVKKRLSGRLKDSGIKMAGNFYPLQKRLRPEQLRRIQDLREKQPGKNK
ncbi:MAG: NYN domain-containing protein [Actinobacteria bacterium]|nr:NYN domain-containing protein [Actinomycetota bacterium]